VVGDGVVRAGAVAQDAPITTTQQANALAAVRFIVKIGVA
jgi:hypothetical protein